MNMKNYCELCPKKDKCTELCATVLEYVDQDYVGQRENLIGNMDEFSYDDRIKPMPDIQKDVLIHLTPKQQEVVEMYYNEGKTQKAIGVLLGITQPSVSIRLTAAKEILKIYK